jgi:hypothetical protein
VTANGDGKLKGWNALGIRRQRQRQTKVVRIQSAVRGWSIRRKLEATLAQALFGIMEEQAATLIQAHTRGRFVRQGVTHAQQREHDAVRRRKRRQLWLRAGGGVELELNAEVFITPRARNRTKSKASRARVNRIEIPAAAAGIVEIQGIEIEQIQNGMEVILYDDSSKETSLSLLWLANDLRHFYWRTTDKTDLNDKTAKRAY